MVALSVIIPTYNRAALIRRCVDALARQTLDPARYEVVVVVDGSVDGTADLLRGMPVPFRLRVEVQANQGQAAARNRGIAIARGEYCLLIDDDIIAEPELLARHLEAQQTRGGIVGLGHMTCRLPRGADTFARSVGAWWVDHYAALGDGRQPTWTDCFTGNLSVPLAALRAVGGLATDLAANLDIELGFRLQRYGLPIVYLPDAIGHQEYDKRFAGIVADARRQGRDDVRIYERFPETLPEQLLSRFSEARPRIVLLRRVLLALGVPMSVLQAASRLLGRGPRARVWYSFVYDYAYWCGAREVVSDDRWRRLTNPPLILMYHAFSRPRERPSRYVVPGRRLAQQLRWLRRLGYRPLRLRDLLDQRRAYRLPPAKSVVITIDDGYADVQRVALPLLRRFGFPATLFLVSERLGATNDWDATGPLAGRPLLTWDALRQMDAADIEVGAHTRTHRALPTVPQAEREAETAGSGRDLAQGLGRPVTTLAYPFGGVDPSVRALVEHAGFEAAFAVRDAAASPADDAYLLPRIEVFGTDSLARFLLGVLVGDPLRKVRWLRPL